jgi:nitroreductase
MQRWRFLVITNAEIKREVGGPTTSARGTSRLHRGIGPGNLPWRDSGTISAIARRGGVYLAAHIHEAPVWIVPCLEGGTPTRTSGSSIYPAVQYMLLTARALGLGTTLTTLYLQFEKEAEAALGLPPGVHSYALLPIGYPMGRFGRVRRVPLTDVVFGVRFTRPDRSQGGDYVCSGLQMALALAAAEPHRGACTRIEASGFAGI